MKIFKLFAHKNCLNYKIKEYLPPPFSLSYLDSLNVFFHVYNNLFVINNSARAFLCTFSLAATMNGPAK